VGIRLAVDREDVELTHAARDFFEDHVERVVRCARGLGAFGVAEDGVIPAQVGGFEPLGLLVLTGVLDDDAEAGHADGVFRRTENPDTRVIHFDNGVDAFASADEEALDRLWCGDGVSVESDDLEFVSGEGDAAVFDGAGVEEVEEDALAFFDADGLARTKGLIVNGVGV